MNCTLSISQYNYTLVIVHGHAYSSVVHSNFRIPYFDQKRFKAKFNIFTFFNADISLFKMQDWVLRLECPLYFMIHLEQVVRLPQKQVDAKKSVPSLPEKLSHT